MNSHTFFLTPPRALTACTLLATLAWVLAPIPALSQPRLDDLERKLEEAKDRQRREAQRPAAPANTGRVVVDADASCELRVNGERVRALQAGDAATITVPAGEQLIECLSSSVQGVRVRQVLAVERGKQVVLSLPLKAAESERLGAAQVQETQRRSAAEMARRLSPVSSEVLFDSRWGLQWTRSDSRGNMNWQQARSYCEGLGGGWSLPTVAQLQSLHDGALPGVPCDNYTCKVSDQFRLSSYWFWSSEPSGSSEAWFVSLNYGSRNSGRVGYSDYRRALCVRRP